jgi:hypothetical protein
MGCHGKLCQGNAMGSQGDDKQCQGKPRPRHAMAWAVKAMPLTSFRDLTDIYHKVDLKSLVM